MFNTIRKIFKRHGAGEIDTPVFEEKDVLMGKYGEDSKLIYDLADQGGALLSLRYDLTVPFARFLATNSVGNIKRFHIGKVYRRDNPVLSKGRFREFYQCDYDMAGDYGLMTAEADVLSLACEIFVELGFTEFEVRLNHRCLLDGMMRVCGVPQELYRPISSAIDKLDKEEWSEVSKEMKIKGLTNESCEKIHSYVVRKGSPLKLLAELKKDELFVQDELVMKALEELQMLFEYLEAMDLNKYFLLDLSLARGLDYYTGVIYEIGLLGANVGSVSAGGRYDNLVGMFTPERKQTPCIGISIGVERIFSLLQARKLSETKDVVKRIFSKVIVAPIGDNLLPQAMKILKITRDLNFSADLYYVKNVNVKKQLAYALENQIGYLVLFGETELQSGQVKIKDLENRREELVYFTDIGSKLLEFGCPTVN